MMNWVDSSCSACGDFHPYNQTCNNGYFPGVYPLQNGDTYGYNSSVDCTLSLGTPSTRLSEEDEMRERFYRSQSQRRIQTPSFSRSRDPMLARRCSNCNTTSTPLWRNGPRGPKSLCNACGIRFKKEEKRSNGGAPSGAMEMINHPNLMNNYNYSYGYDGGMASWGHHQAPELNHYQQDQLVQVDEADQNSSTMNFLSWTLNVADSRTGLLHDFIR